MTPENLHLLSRVPQKPSNLSGNHQTDPVVLAPVTDQHYRDSPRRSPSPVATFTRISVTSSEVVQEGDPSQLTPQNRVPLSYTAALPLSTPSALYSDYNPEAALSTLIAGLCGPQTTCPGVPAVPLSDPLTQTTKCALRSKTRMMCCRSATSRTGASRAARARSTRIRCVGM